MPISSSVFLLGGGLMVLVGGRRGGWKKLLRRVSHWLTAVLLVGLWLSAAQAAPVGQTDDEVDQAAEPVMEALTQSLQNGNFQLYSQYNDASAAETNPQVRFIKMRSLLTRIGGIWDSYLYEGFLNVENRTVVFWKVHINKSNRDVPVSMTLSREGDQLIMRGVTGSF